MIDSDARRDALLDAGARLLLERGYDKTSMSDVAEAADLSRTIVYRHFSSKADLVDALLARTLRRYLGTWRQALADDPSPGTVPSIYRATVRTVVADRLLTAVYTRDETVWGRYLRRDDHQLPRLGGDSPTHSFLLAMRRAGTVRDGVDLASVAVVMDSTTPALLRHLAPVPGGDQAELTELLGTVAEMLDRMLTPPEPDTDAALRSIDALLAGVTDPADVRATDAGTGV
ncbi:TetR/AcrR family transcriptional regulator [Brachybacterium sp. YJGR34]|uniref:TetR/AcrR family transcriptional regulator n=1 Tax=Brachybacterium sp. YJGR34 TaxID=2059911 RepID=UPI000E0A3062|nr:helix-turn-helix domain-containing protein [Brachybacterium sp. YJGR34]